MDLYVKLGIALRRARRNADLSQRSLGEKIGISHQQILKYENGKNKIPVHNLLKIIEITKTDIKEMLRGL